MRQYQVRIKRRFFGPIALSENWQDNLYWIFNAVNETEAFRKALNDFTENFSHNSRLIDHEIKLLK